MNDTASSMTNALYPKPKLFAERLRMFCEKLNEDPSRTLFDENFEELRADYLQNRTPLKTLWDFMVSDAKDSRKSFEVTLSTFRRWWYEKAPEDKRSRKKKGEIKV